MQLRVCRTCDTDPDPVAPFWVAACVAKRCELVDLRAQDITHCRTDDECIARGRSCCGAYTGDPGLYVGLRRDAEQAVFACIPEPPCVPPPESIEEPVAFCANDGHCAVRRREASD